MAQAALTIDAGGVLLVPDPAALREALADFAVEPTDEDCRRAHYEVMHLIDETPDPDYVAVSALLAAALGVPSDRVRRAGPVLAAAYVGSRWVPAPGAAEALARLESAGYPLAVVSNSSHGQIERLLTEFGLCGTSGPGARMAVVLDSHVVGIEKPDVRIFELAARALGTPPSRCTHVGDSVSVDVVGAEAAGMAAIHIDPYGFCHSDQHAHAASLGAVADDLVSQ
ncbi:MAG TPA: HAD family hydrolase [Acidimicrobiales bacterium]|jgi:putative hydrolase of the HAD superfamily